jgi:triosephosphate isomerase (TIM)
LKKLCKKGARTPVLYGGSVTAETAPQLAATKNVDGALVGGASLEAHSFISIIRGFFQ